MLNFFFAKSYKVFELCSEQLSRTRIHQTLSNMTWVKPSTYIHKPDFDLLHIFFTLFLKKTRGEISPTTNPDCTLQSVKRVKSTTPLYNTVMS